MPLTVNRKYSSDKTEFDFYISVIKAGKEFYYRQYPDRTAGGLDWAYRQTGRFNETSLGLLHSLLNKWTGV